MLIKVNNIEFYLDHLKFRLQMSWMKGKSQPIPEYTMIIDEIVTKISKARVKGEPDSIFLNKQQERLLHQGTVPDDMKTELGNNGCIQSIDGIRVVIIDDTEWKIQISIKL